MNVWAIQKDMPLKLLLLELVHRYGENTLALNTREQHHQAIDLCTLNDPSLSAYIYTVSTLKSMANTNATKLP